MEIDMYRMTVWKLEGKTNEVSAKFECSMETHWHAIEIYDCVTRGIRGHYKAWLVDELENKQIRMSEVCY